MKRLLYPALALLFLIAAASQIVYTIDVLHLLAGDYPVKPFSVGEPWPSVRAAGPSARQGGLRDTDRIVAIDGRILDGLVDFETAVRAHKPGDLLRVNVLRDGRNVECPVVVRESPERPSALFAAVAWIFMPAFSVLLGFWVAAARPRDFRAWLMLGTLLGLSHMTRNWGLSPLGRGRRSGFRAAARLRQHHGLDLDAAVRRLLPQR
jgi:hypothetical protein